MNQFYVFTHRKASFALILWQYIYIKFLPSSAHQLDFNTTKVYLIFGTAKSFFKFFLKFFYHLKITISGTLQYFSPRLRHYWLQMTH